jgi:hypothetical protein
MMDTLRNALRVVGSALMNSEMVYSFLMGIGWFFLLGWAFALVVACASVFRQDHNLHTRMSGGVRSTKLAAKPSIGK